MTADCPLHHDEVAATARPILRMEDITRHFGPVIALNGARCDVTRGEGHCLPGDTGAGKSSLIKTTSEIHKQGSGRIVVKGKRMCFDSARQAMSAMALIRAASGAHGTFAASRAAHDRHCPLQWEIHRCAGSVGFDPENMNEHWVCRAGEAGLTRHLTAPAQPEFVAFYPAPGHDSGFTEMKGAEARDLRAATARLPEGPPCFDLIVGTEEEFHIAGGSTDTPEALRRVRAASAATLVCKRGPMGASAFEGAMSDSLDDGLTGPGFPIEVFNMRGAGDGFMAGLWTGWLDGETWPVTLKDAHACGAFAVSRHGCTPACPSWEELQFFFERGVQRPDLRHDAELEQRHRATRRGFVHGGVLCAGGPATAGQGPCGLADDLRRCRARLAERRNG